MEQKARHGMSGECWNDCFYLFVFPCGISLLHATRMFSEGWQQDTNPQKTTPDFYWPSQKKKENAEEIWPRNTKSSAMHWDSDENCIFKTSRLFTISPPKVPQALGGEKERKKQDIKVLCWEYSEGVNICWWHFNIFANFSTILITSWFFVLPIINTRQCA